MQGAVSIEIAEIIWICNVMGFWKEFAQTGPEKACDNVMINKLE
jgi:hypothetical protein